MSEPVTAGDEAVASTVEEVIRHRLSAALGGWRGSLETALPTIAFVLGWTLTEDVRIAVAAAGVIALLLAGLGWGNMPAPMVAEDIQAGRLAKLPLAAGAGEPYRFQAIYRTEVPPGPAAAWLLQRLLDQGIA